MAESEDKVARNNLAFRTANDEIGTAAAREGLDDGRRTPFLCECPDPRCTEIVSLTLEEYRHVRSDPRWFVEIPGHEASEPAAVGVIEEREGYVVVEKPTTV
jgi:hypothetical protein